MSVSKSRCPTGPLLAVIAPVLVVFAVSATAVPAWAQDDSDCLECHEESSLFEGLKNEASLVVTEAAHAASMHGSAGIGCVDCHQDLADMDGLHEEVAPALCATCHDDIQTEFEESVHGYAHQRGNPRAPNCSSCHGAHDILPASDPASRTHGVRLFTICANCHASNGRTKEGFVKHVQTASAFASSVHGRPDAAGEVAASCVDCHGVHRLRGSADHDSSIHRANVATTCGACHSHIRDEYARSIHGQALDAGISDSPTCVDCHGEHMIQSTHDSGENGITTAELAAETCEACHNNPRIIAKYDLDGAVVDTYEDSYHGWATERDSDRAATCVSCHTAHSVLPAEHPDSTIHAANVVETCRKCHERADDRFAASYNHESASLTANPINRAIRNFYWVLIGVVIGGMALHNLVILAHFATRRRRVIKGAAWIQRFTPLEIVQHMLLASSFILLVVTGFALRYPNAWWVRYLGFLGMSEVVRANLHRVFAVVMVGASVLHLVYLGFTRRGRGAFGDMLPARHDITGFVDSMRYHAGRTSRPPRFGRFDYTQKAEYWALIWGTALMAATGFVLWFPELAVKILPAWIVPASQTVHYYEAWLATLAIVIWHFFFVIFHPEEYPMNWTWLHGKMSETAVQEHHGQWYDEQVAIRTAEAQRDTASDAAKPKAS